MYSLYAWGVPLVIVAFGHAADHIDLLKEYRPFYAGRLCWINSTLGLGIFYAFPISCLVLENVVFFIITLVCIFQLRYAIVIRILVGRKLYKRILGIYFISHLKELN